MRKIKLAVWILFAICLFACQGKQDAPRIAVMAYYMPRANGPSIEELPLGQLTHIIYSFTEVIDNQMQFPEPSLENHLRLLVKQKEKYPHLKVMIACGGWGGSRGFSEMANNAEYRKKFVKSCVQFLDDYQLDGLDIDWEYPGLKGIGNPHRPEDKANFTSLMQELRKEMNLSRDNYLLTFASAGWEKYYNFIELEKVMHSVDYINIMTYDNVGGLDSVTFHHTNLGLITINDLLGTPAYNYITLADEPYHPRSAQYIIDFCISKGVHPKQIVIGAAFYGKGWIGVDPQNDGLYQNNKGGWQGASYKHLKSDFINQNGYVRHWDSIAMTPYLFNARDSIFITYDDPLSVSLKTQYAIDKGLGGIMFWELGNDTQEYDLLNSIEQTIKQK